MLGKYKGYGVFILTVLLMSLPLQAEATVPVSSGYKSPGEVVFIVMHYEDASAIAPIQLKLEQDLLALEHAFKTLQKEGKLDPDFPRLVIIASKYYRLENRFETAPAELSFTNSATFVSNHPESPQFEPKELGPAYVIRISTGLLNYRDLAAMMPLLGGLNDQAPRITINSEEKLAVWKRQPDFERLISLINVPEEFGAVAGGFRIAALWKAETTFYSLTDEEGNKILDLFPANIYKGRPAWAPVERPELHARILAYATDEQVIIYDFTKGTYIIYHLNLDFTFNDRRIQEIFDGMRDAIHVHFAVDAVEDKVYVLPFGRMGWINVVYSLDLDTGAWTRELEGGLVSDEVWKNKQNGSWIDFISAVPDRKIVGNVDILTEEWTEGQNFPAVSVKRNQTILLWLSLLIIPGAMLIYLKLRKNIKMGGRDDEKTSVANH
ncbi:MAG: hypothetical protein KGZ75_04840 [Syntrophomonadaceae bacterium]|nr:hypothetical protein [Syntrophomonadaceae bacterium]MCL5982579.1 hypothetical protein [Bacillota bacterium]